MEKTSVLDAPRICNKMVNVEKGAEKTRDDKKCNIAHWNAKPKVKP